MAQTFIVKGDVVTNASDNDFGRAQYVRITATSEPIESVEIFNILGQRVLNLVFDATPSKNINITSLIGGMYLIKINEEATKRLIVK